MEVKLTKVHHSREGEEMEAYLAVPPGEGPRPAVVVIQEIWGPDAHIQDMAVRFATSGYVALAPDLYSRGGRPEALSETRIEEVKAFLDRVPPQAWWDEAARNEALSKEDPEAAERIRGTMGALFGPRDEDGMVNDIRAWIRWLRERAEVGGRKIATIGYCMGGSLSFRTAAAGEELGAAFVYYGSAPDEEAMAGIRCPVYGFYGEKDPRLTDAVPDVAKAMKAHGKMYEPVVYEGAPHAFFNDTRISFRPEAARRAWARTIRLLDERLGA